MFNELVLKVAALATDFDAAGDFEKAEKLDQLLEKAAAGWNKYREPNDPYDPGEGVTGPTGMHAEELEDHDLETVKPNVGESLKADQMNVVSPEQAGLGFDDNTYSGILIEFKDHFKTWMKHELENNEPRTVLKDLGLLFDTMAQKGDGRATRDHDFASVAEKLLNEVLQTEQQ